MIRQLTLALLASTAVLPVAAHAQARPPVLPSGGQVAAGQATIASAGNGMTITQGSDRAVINWLDFSIGKGDRVDILQPGAGSALLNRVTGSATSVLAGQLNANGQVYLVNPNGILITRTGSVNAAGFVASTLDLSDKAFMAGDIVVTGKGGRVANHGTISIVKGGYAALLGGKVDNAGMIVAPLGKVALGAGTQATLDLEGDGFLQVALPASDGGVAMSGRIVADGGAVLLSAAQARDAARGVVNLSGSIEARGIESKGGSVVLTGDDIRLTGATVDVSGATGGGTVRIGGDRQGQGLLAHAQTLSVDTASAIRADATSQGSGGDVVLWSDTRTDDAGSISARGAGDGSGGDAEVSSHGVLAYTGTTDLTGKTFGTLLLDPFNVTISDAAQSGQANFTATGNDSIINAGILAAALATADVTISTGTSGTQPGNITVAAPVSWSSGALLTLNAAGSISVNAPINVMGDGKVALNFSPTADTVTGGLSFAAGNAITFADGQAGQGLSVNGNAYTLLHSIAAVAAIDTTDPSGNYALAHDLDASGKTYASALVGQGDNAFSGILEGLGHSVSNLTISDQWGSYIGLVGFLTGTVRDIGTVGGSISGLQYVGELVGENQGTVMNAYATGTINGFGNFIGGLVGDNEGAVSNAYATGAVRQVSSLPGVASSAGGLVGYNSGTVSNVYATGAVGGVNDIGGLVGYNVGKVINAYATGAVNGTSYIGGLVGDNDNLGGVYFGSIANSYATGAVSISGPPDSGSISAGGLVGWSSADIINSYWDIETTGSTGFSGVNLNGPLDATGLPTAQLQAASAATKLGSAFAGGAGLYPYLKSFYPNGVQAISGTAYTSGGAAAPAAQVSLYRGGTGLGNGTTSTGVNGYYYTIVPAGTFAGGNNTLGQTLTLSGANAASGLSYSDALTFDANGNLSGLTIRSGARDATTGSRTWSDLSDALSSTFGTSLASLASALGSAPESITANASSGFTLDRALDLNSDLDVRTTAGDLTIAAPVVLEGGNSLTLTSGGNLAIDDMIRIVGGGKLALNYNPSNVVTGGLSFASGASINYADGQDGQGLGINGASYTLLYSIAEVVAIGATGPSGNYALAHDLDAGDTIYTRALVGTDYANRLSGTLEGLGHTISNLTISDVNHSNVYVGLVGYLTGTVRDIGMIGGSISGAQNVGGLIGYNDGTVRNAFTTSTVGGSGSNVGGLIGYNDGTVSNAYAIGAVGDSGSNIGGLIGYNIGSASNAYATGAVSGTDKVGGLVGVNIGTVSNAYATGAVSGTAEIGGLVGSNDHDAGFDVGSVSNSYATGAVSGSRSVGGLVGYNSIDIVNSYWDIETSGTSVGFNGAGSGSPPQVIGLSTAQFQTASATSNLGSPFEGGAGLYPYLKSFYPNGVQAISGTAYTSGGAVAPSAQIGVYSGGSLLGGTTVSSGANGYYYTIVSAGTFTGGTTTLGLTITPSGAPSASGFGYSDALALDANGNLSDLDVTAGLRNVTTTGQTWSDMAAGLSSAFGTSTYASLASTLASTSESIAATSATGFTLDDALSLGGGDLTLTTAGDLTLALGSRIAADTITIASSGNFINRAGATAFSAGSRWLVYSVDPRLDTKGGLAADFLQYNAAHGSTAVAQPSGNGFLYTLAPVLTVSLTGSVEKTYDGTTAASLVTGNYAVSGTIGSDAVTLAATDERYDSANAGAARTVSVDGLAIRSATNGTTAVYGYQLASTTATGAVGKIDPATLTYVASPTSRAYGDTNPAFTGTIAGFVNGESQTSATTGVAKFSATADALSNVGDYAIMGSGLVANNGNYVFVQATDNATGLTIAARPITITPDAGRSKVYGNADPALTYTVGGAGLVNGDTLSGGLARSAGENVGAYAIGQGSLAASSNYALTFDTAPISFTITPRPITVTAGALSRLYGDTNPALTYAISDGGLVNGDTLSGGLATAATTTSGVGNYAITQGSLGASANYSLTYVGANLAIAPRSLVITADAASRLYGDANPVSGTASADNLVNGDTVTSVTLSSPATATSNVGSYALTGSDAVGSGLSNYAIIYATRIDGLTIAPRPITVTADALSRVYGDADPTLTYKIGGDGLVNGDTLSGGLSTSATLTSGVGAYAIGEGTLDAGANYAVTYVGADLSVTRRPITITPDANQGKVYGNRDPALTYTVGGEGLVNGDTLSGSLTRDAGENVGAYMIDLGTLAASGNYTLGFSTVPVSFAITPRPITISADALSRIYGDANPALTYRVGGAGLVDGDTLSGSLATGANITSGVGNYAIGRGSLDAGGNYSLSFIGTDLTVTPRAITISPDAGQDKVYGYADPALSYTIGGEGLVNGDTLSGSLARNIGENVGAYTIDLGTLAASGNYTLGFSTAPVSFAITPRPLTVTADALSRIYGNANPALTYAIGGEGLVDGDTLSGALATGATITSGIGAYAIGQGTLNAGANYNLSFTGADLTITPRPILVSANALSRIYGDTNPALTYTVGGDGLVNGDVLSGSLATAATAGSSVGNYVIAQGSLGASANYSLTYADADLTVIPRPITITPDADQGKVYGYADPALTFTVGGQGMVNGDTLSGSLTRDAGENVGAYMIDQGTLAASGNYTLGFSTAPVSFAITPRPITITADALSRIYGNANPALTYAVGGDGLVNGDTLSGALATGATITSGIGAYTIGQGTLNAGANYNLSFTGADLTVVPRSITIMPDDGQGKIYGNVDPALTYAVGGEGLVNGDTLSGSLTRDAGENVGAYAIDQGTLAASGNYTLGFDMAPISFAITPRPITISADALSRIYGDTNPALTYTIGGDGLVNGDRLSGSLATAATVRSSVGSYAIGQGSLGASANYSLSYVGANLAITPRALVITADAANRLYGDANPVSGTASANNLVNGDTVTSVALSSPATATSNVGSYALTGSDAIGSGLSNYDITYATRVDGLTIAPRPITVAADVLSRLYGNANPALTYRVGGNGLVNGDMLSGALATAATIASSVGSYAIRQGTLDAGANYSLSFTGADLMIIPRPITITAANVSRAFGTPNPALTYTIGGQGLANGDILSGALYLAASPTSVPGIYAIRLGNLTASPNYAVTYVAGTLTINRPGLVTGSGAGLLASSVLRDSFAADILPSVDAAVLAATTLPPRGGVYSMQTVTPMICPRDQGCAFR